MTYAYFALAMAALCWALWRKRDACTVALACGFVASLAVMNAGVWSIMPFAAAIDAATCVVMLGLWTRFCSMRAWSIGFIGLAKTGATLLQYWAAPHDISWTYALFINIAFLGQVLIAGGLADALGHWADDLLARFAPRRHMLLRNGTR